MEDIQSFLSPQLSGKRFEDHTIPADLLEDFSVIEELIFAIAKDIFLEKNPERKRVPNGFTDEVSLKLKNIEPGSSIPIFIIASAMGLASNGNIRYFEQAKDRLVSIIENANNGQVYDSGLQEKYKTFFNRIGKNLKEDENIIFKPHEPKNKAILNKITRKTIILSMGAGTEYSDSISINALIPEVDKSKKTFSIEIDGVKFPNIPIDKTNSQTILALFDDYENRALAKIKGTGIFDNKDKLIRIESIESIDIIDPLDVSVRLDYLSKVADGWYDESSIGLVSKKLYLTQFDELFDINYDKNLPLPSIFPTIEGNIQLEWSINEYEISLEVFLNNFTAELISVNTVTNQVRDEKYDLHEAGGWNQLYNTLNELKLVNER